MRFTKMHGIGNDYVYINGYEQSPPSDPAALAELAKRISDRHFGVGSDGLILVIPPEVGVDAHVRMRMFNADGSEAEMCGNGIRCVCKLAYDSGVCTENPIRIQTGNGVLTLDYTLSDDGKVNMVTVDMGQPVLDLPGIGVIESQLSELVEDTEDSMIFVGMGNPHAVDMIDEDDIDPTIYPHSDSAWAALGEAIEHHPAFPSRINYHHVVIHSPTRVTVRHWERGSGATLACGTGACAVCVAGVLTGRTDRQITAHLPGGDLQLEWREADAAEGGNHVFMTGPATTVFEGEWLL